VSRLSPPDPYTLIQPVDIDDITRRQRLNHGRCPLHDIALYVHGQDACGTLDVRCGASGCPVQLYVRPCDKLYRIFVEPRVDPGGAA